MLTQARPANLYMAFRGNLLDYIMLPHECPLWIRELSVTTVEAYVAGLLLYLSIHPAANMSVLLGIIYDRQRCLIQHRQCIRHSAVNDDLRPPC